MLNLYDAVIQHTVGHEGSLPTPSMLDGAWLNNGCQRMCAMTEMIPRWVTCTTDVGKTNHDAVDLKKTPLSHQARGFLYLTQLIHWRHVVMTAIKNLEQQHFWFRRSVIGLSLLGCACKMDATPTNSQVNSLEMPLGTLKRNENVLWEEWKPAGEKMLPSTSAALRPFCKTAYGANRAKIAK